MISRRPGGADTIARAVKGAVEGVKESLPFKKKKAEKAEEKKGQ